MGEMDFKLDYMARLFRRMQNKRFESYAIQRIWHRLGDPEIRFVSQQYFKRKDTGGFALADLYLPQFRMVVEIDEGQHAGNGQADSARSAQIVEVSKSEVHRIPIYKTVDDAGNILEWKSLDEFNQDIDDVIDIIRDKKAAAKDFLPWTGDILSVQYHQSKGYFCVSDNDYVKTIDDIASIFGTTATHLGFYRRAGFNIPGKANTIVWCPSVYSDDWTNMLSDDGTVIVEFETEASSDKRMQHYMNAHRSGQIRVTFFKAKDSLGYNFYRFIGVFSVDLVRSDALNKTVWTRISDRFVL